MECIHICHFLLFLCTFPYHCTSVFLLFWCFPLIVDVFPLVLVCHPDLFIFLSINLCGILLLSIHFGLLWRHFIKGTSSKCKEWNNQHGDTKTMYSSIPGLLLHNNSRFTIRKKEVSFVVIFYSSQLTSPTTPG